MNQILVAKEKHGDTYWRASSKDELQASALSILTDRFESCWYDVGREPVAPELSKEQVAALPEEYRQHEEQKRKVYDAEFNSYHRDKRFYEAVKSEIAKPKGWAWNLLLKRKYNEYEEVELCQVR